MSYSLNAPVPESVRALAARLREDLPAGVRPRERPTLVVKRVGDGDHRALADRTRAVLGDASPCPARIAGLGTFAAATGPVTYLAVESPGLRALHDRLCTSFDPVPDIEGEDYVPHVTLGRGGDPDAVRAFCERGVDPVEWTVSSLHLWSARYREPVTAIPVG
ncbi:2'-5' RNA ligase family protein [Halomarina litorea]|uniref:2'-5' RNA ligase family protein n=1 Tax=Halomarina litorea TaxID=2961595 RepID=UPI0020C386BE|nr:2'-5' RNA ligase family protein [Halomarina sp. BCD28]